MKKLGKRIVAIICVISLLMGTGAVSVWAEEFKQTESLAKGVEYSERIISEASESDGDELYGTQKTIGDAFESEAEEPEASSESESRTLEDSSESEVEKPEASSESESRTLEDSSELEVETSGDSVMSESNMPEDSSKDASFVLTDDEEPEIFFENEYPATHDEEEVSVYTEKYDEDSLEENEQPEFVGAVARTKDEAISWVYAQEGKKLDYDGAYGAQCVDLIKYYYAFFGVAEYAMGNGCKYAENDLPPNWTRIKNTASFIPEPGDVAVWTSAIGSGAGHVAIILSATSSSFVSMDQNWPKGSACKQVTHNYNNFWGVVRPAYSGSSNICNCSESYAGNYRCTSNTTLLIRSGHGTSYSSLGSIRGNCICFKS